MNGLLFEICYESLNDCKYSFYSDIFINYSKKNRRKNYFRRFNTSFCLVLVSNFREELDTHQPHFGFAKIVFAKFIQCRFNSVGFC